MCGASSLSEIDRRPGRGVIHWRGIGTIEFIMISKVSRRLPLLQDSLITFIFVFLASRPIGLGLVHERSSDSSSLPERLVHPHPFTSNACHLRTRSLIFTSMDTSSRAARFCLWNTWPYLWNTWLYPPFPLHLHVSLRNHPGVRPASGKSRRSHLFIAKICAFNLIVDACSSDDSTCYLQSARLRTLRRPHFVSRTTTSPSLAPPPFAGVPSN